MLMVVTLMAAPLMIVLAMTGPNCLKYHRLAEDGVEGWADVTELHDRTTRGRNHIHYASYRYTVDGSSYASEDRLTYERGADLLPNARLPILYDPAAPGQSVVDRGAAIEDRYKDALQRLEVMGGVALLPLLFTVLVVSAQYFKERRLLKWGVAVPATIVAEERCQNRGGESITLHYQFVDATGTTYRGERPGIPLPETAGYIGRVKHQRLMATPIAIYHPRHPDLNVLYPLEWVELRYEMPILSGEITQ
jgi:hypothetical protein